MLHLSKPALHLHKMSFHPETSHTLLLWHFLTSWRHRQQIQSGNGRWKQMPPSPLVPDQKDWGAALRASTATVFVCSQGSKLVTVSFHLWRWSLNSCWEEGPPRCVGRVLPLWRSGDSSETRRRYFGTIYELRWQRVRVAHVDASFCLAAGSEMFVFTNVFTAGVLSFNFLPVP